MKGYPKIDTLFNRSKEDFKVIEWDFRNPAFDAIEFWNVTEKVDGTNIRLDFRRNAEGTLDTQWGGRTDNAQLAADLIKVLDETIAGAIDGIDAQMVKYDVNSLTLYGEGYGPGIQKVGVKYATQKSFVLFDVLVNDRTWLDEAGISETAEEAAVQRVELAPNPMALFEIVEMVKFGIYSDLAHDQTGEKLMAEGVVCRPLSPLFDARGNRVIFKLKHSDFPRTDLLASAFAA